MKKYTANELQMKLFKVKKLINFVRTASGMFGIRQKVKVYTDTMDLISRNSQLTMA